MFQRLSSQTLSHNFLFWVKQYNELPRYYACDGLGASVSAEVLCTLYCSLPSSVKRVRLSPSLKLACFVNILSVASGFVTVTPSFFRCNDGFVDSFCQSHYCDLPIIENIHVLEKRYLSDGYVLNRICGRLFDLDGKALNDAFAQLLACVDQGLQSGYEEGYYLCRFTEELLKDIYDQNYYTGADDQPWDAEAFLELFLPAWESRNRQAQHQIRAAYYREHMDLVKKGSYITDSGNRVRIPNDPTVAMNRTRIYSQELFPAPSDGQIQTRYAVFNEDCLVVAKQLQDECAGKTAVLNLANRQVPGGGVYTGSGAQEESCFLRSNYFLFLYPYASFAAMYGLPCGPVSYPMDRNFGGNYCEGVTVFRGKELEGYPLLEEPWKTNFIAVAALNRPELVYTPTGEARICDALVPAALNKIRTVLNIAIDNDVDNLVLGAMGCGAFRNPPKHMAELFRQVLCEPAYRNRFANIVFAIKGEDNYLPFHAIFGAVDGEL